ncbi:MAG TPA: heme-binding protein [Bradyrhizobium sp.]|nr:heme-binding protein [Bradyrhizobium sp.]
MSRFLFKVGMIVAMASAAIPAEAQIAKSGYALPLSLAMEAAAEAVRACESNGYAVSASVVDPSGVVKVQAKGDHSTIHTRDSSFRKAYTVVTLGPIFHFDTSGVFAEMVAKNPAGPALASLPDIFPLAGGVAIKAGDEIVAALGVGGAPGGDKDEACARAGVTKIQDRVTATQKRAG